MMSIKAKRCGVMFDPPSIVLIYENEDRGKIRKRVIPVRNFSQYSGLMFVFILQTLNVKIIINHKLHRHFYFGLILAKVIK